MVLHHERGAVEVQFRVGCGVVQRGRYRPVLEAQNGLDKTGDAGGHLEVADVGLHRTQNAGRLPVLR